MRNSDRRDEIHIVGTEVEIEEKSVCRFSLGCATISQLKGFSATLALSLLL